MISEESHPQQPSTSCLPAVLQTASSSTLLELTTKAFISDESIIDGGVTTPSQLPLEHFAMNKEVMRCKEEDHEGARLKFLCTDNTCKSRSRLACAECILIVHRDHKYILLEKFVGDVQEKYCRVSSQAKSLEQASQCEDFQESLTEEVKSEFADLKNTIVRQFEEFEKEYLSQIGKCIDNARPKCEFLEKFHSVYALAETSFEKLDEHQIIKVIEFSQEDALEKTIDDTDKSLAKTKLNISKKKAKYFEKFRSIVKDILVDCNKTTTTTTPTKDQSDIVEDKKKRKITFNDEPSVIYDPQQNTTAAAAAHSSSFKQPVIADLQSFSTRSFATETRRYSSSVNKKIKSSSETATTPAATNTNTQQAITSSQ